MRFLWPEVRLAMESVVGLGRELAVPGTPALVGDKPNPGLVFPAGALSVDQCLILCTELSKLLKEESADPSHNGRYQRT